MVKFLPGRKRKKFIDINLASPKKRALFAFSLGGLPRKQLLVGTFSIVSFIGIFAVYYLGERQITSLQGEINRLDQKIRTASLQLNRLKRLYKTADRKFRKLYIANLKEKVFLLAYYERFRPQLWKTVSQFASIVKRYPPFIGFVEYPNPYKPLSQQSVTPSKIHLVEYRKLDKNFFLDPDRDKVANTFSVKIELKPVEEKIRKNLEKIHDKEIKANLLLEYQLLKYGWEKLKKKTPFYLIFPVNIAFADTESYRETFQNLRQFCNYLLINREYTQQLYFKGERIKTVIDAICVKQSF